VVGHRTLIDPRRALEMNGTLAVGSLAYLERSVVVSETLLLECLSVGALDRALRAVPLEAATLREGGAMVTDSPEMFCEYAA
jgi:hypothetical protein